ncbi:MAG: hypothetical protein JXA33_18900 [Anaerolineae bacterium]|nr:hypothetical protein [Anaerolineae bacterium]
MAASQFSDTLRLNRNSGNEVYALKAKRIPITVRLLPIVFFFSYLNFTVFLFAYGPWPYPVVDGEALYIFLALAHLALLTGYLSAAFGKPRSYFGRWQVKSVLLFSLLANLILLWPTIAFRTGSWLLDLHTAISNPGIAYSHSLAQRLQTTPIIEYIRILLGPLLFMVLPLAVFYRCRLKLWVLGLGVFVILGTVAMFVAMGTNKGIADTIFLTLWLLLAGHLSGVSRLRWRSKVVLLAGGLLAVGLFLAFFSAGMMTRSGSGALTGYFTAARIYADSDNFLVQYLPADLRVGVYGLTSYLTQGYYALYLALKEPFVPMAGIGNSTFLSNQVSKITGLTEIMQLSYPARIEKYGWNAYTFWSSIYPWIASDASFPGTIPIVFFIGRFFAQSWLDTLRGENLFAVAMFAQFLIMLFYFPANNQVVQSGESYMTFWCIFICWILTRKMYRLKNNERICA